MGKKTGVKKQMDSQKVQLLGRVLMVGRMHRTGWLLVVIYRMGWRFVVESNQNFGVVEGMIELWFVMVSNQSFGVVVWRCKGMIEVVVRGKGMIEVVVPSKGMNESSLT